MSIIDGLLNFASHHEGLQGPLKLLNRELINHFARAIPPRPRAFSLWSPAAAGATNAPDYNTEYTSWPGLTNKRFSGRHLPPAPLTYAAGLPVDVRYQYGDPNAPVGEVTSLFKRPEGNGGMKPARSSLLFMFFAQWFTDSLLRINFEDRRTNKSNHDIDLCQIYGLTEESCRLLRLRSESPKERGKLRSQLIRGEEYLDYLCENVSADPANPQYQVKAQYQGLEANQVGLDKLLIGFDPKRAEKFFATGLERGNSSIGYVAISTIFMREHNRLAGRLALENPTWGDERVFQTARNINIVLLMKLVVEDYINHILGHHVFKLDHDFAEKEHWYRANWIALEFDLLYRWHGLAPDVVTVNGTALQPGVFRNNNVLLEEIGLGPLIDTVSRQPAGKIGLGNTPRYLLGAEFESIKMSRDFRVQPYNQYRLLFDLPKKKDFADLTADTAMQTKLAKLYGDIENVEFIVGLFAEDPSPGLLFGDLLNRMVAYDAFTQIFSNPLLSQNVYNKETFTQYGLDLIAETTSIEVLVNRNVSEPVRASLGVP